MEALSYNDELNIDLSILREVKIATERLAEINKGNESSHAVDEATLRARSRTSALELLDRQCRELQCQVSGLESEIRMLEDETTGMGEEGGERERRVLDDAELEGTIRSLIGSAVGNPVTLASKEVLLGKLAGTDGMEEDKDMRFLRSQIKLNEVFSQIKFTSVDWEIDRTSLLCEHTHVGTTLGHPFRVTFVVRYVKAEEDCSTNDSGPSDDLRIINLKAEVDKPKIQKDMEYFLSRVSSDCDLMLFYQTYTTYCAFHQNRIATFKSIKSQFNDSAQLSAGSDGNRLRFSIRRGVSLNFTWDIIVSGYGVVKDKVTVQTKTASNASGEVLEIMATIPQLLDKMVFVYGPKDGLLQLFLLFKPNIPSEP